MEPSTLTQRESSESSSIKGHPMVQRGRNCLLYTSALLGMDVSRLTPLFLLYQSRHGNTESWKISVQEFISFISEDVLENEALSGSLSGLDAGSAAQIKSAGALAGAVVSEKAFSPEEMAALLKSCLLYTSRCV